MIFHVLTLFPDMIRDGLNTSVTGRALASGRIRLNAVNIRDYSKDKHKHVDDYPYGGGAGMVMQPEPIALAYEDIGDYVLTGGELPALVMMDAISRLVPGVLNNEDSAEFESFHDNLLEHPHYTRPVEYRGSRVPDVLLSGHHGNIDRWRREQSLKRTLERRPDLLETAELTEKDVEYLRTLGWTKDK